MIFDNDPFGDNPFDETFTAHFVPAAMIEFGRTSKRADSRPALYKVERDPMRGPYWHGLVSIDRTPFEKRRWETQNPEKVTARKVQYDRSAKGQKRYEKYARSEKGRERAGKYDHSEKGRVRTKEFGTKEYLTRPIVAIDSEGRCPLHMIDDKGRSPYTGMEGKSDNLAIPKIRSARKSV